jgi:hypothetical protein
MTKVVQIIAGKSVPYSLNHIDVLEFDDGEFYQVPDHVADGMIARSWARLATNDDVAKAANGGGQPGHGDDPNPKPPPVQEPGKEPPKPQPDDDDDDGDGDGKEDAQHALRTKGKRR